MTGNPLELFKNIFGAVRAIFWLWGSLLAPDYWLALLTRALEGYEPKNCEGFIRHRPPGPHPRIRLALPSSGVDLASIQHRNR